MVQTFVLRTPSAPNSSSVSASPLSVFLHSGYAGTLSDYAAALSDYAAALSDYAGRAALLGALAGLVGCSSFRSSTGVNVPEPQIGKTGTGALTGAAVGGGLGLLVGSTSGNAGEGLLVGSLAGSAVGAGIGAKLERDDRHTEMDTARDKIVEQDDLIQQQNENLDRMRGTAADDNAQLFDSSRLGEDVGVPRHTAEPAASASSRVRSFAPASTGAARTGKNNGRIAEQDALAGSAAPGAVVPASYTTTQRGAAQPAETTRRGQLRLAPTPAAGGIKFLNRPSGEKTPVPYSQQAQGTTEASHTAPAPSVRHSDAVVSKTETTTAKLHPAALKQPTSAERPKSSLPAAAADPRPAEPSKASPAAALATRKDVAPKDQADCKEAVKEAERGLHATADADRLFYLRRAARLCPGEASYHVELGKLYSNVGKNDDAKFEFRQAIDLDPNNEVARDELSIVENAGNISR